MVSNVFKITVLTAVTAISFAHAAAGYFEPWGRDKNLSIEEKTLSTPPKRRNPLSQAAERVILFHQNVLSPADGPRSHFRPTSARYMFLAMRRYGVLKGYLKGCDRLMRENKDPWVYRTISIDHKRYKFDPTYN